MEYITQNKELNSFELAEAGMACLTEQFGIIGAESFIALVLREKLDYTKWRQTYYDTFAPGEFHQKAVEYAKSHPFSGNAERL